MARFFFKKKSMLLHIVWLLLILYAYTALFWMPRKFVTLRCVCQECQELYYYNAQKLWFPRPPFNIFTLRRFCISLYRGGAVVSKIFRHIPIFLRVRYVRRTRSRLKKSFTSIIALPDDYHLMFPESIYVIVLNSNLIMYLRMRALKLFKYVEFEAQYFVKVDHVNSWSGIIRGFELRRSQTPARKSFVLYPKR